MHVEIASITSRGQFVIPQRFRELLGLRAGSKMVVVSDGKHLLLSPIQRSREDEYREVIDHANAIAEKAEKLATKTTKGGSAHEVFPLCQKIHR